MLRALANGTIAAIVCECMLVPFQRYIAVQIKKNICEDGAVSCLQNVRILSNIVLLRLHGAVQHVVRRHGW